MAERTLPGLGLTGFWDLGSSGWKPGMDVNLRLLSALVQGAALSRTAALPGVPVDGEISIVPDTDLTNPNKIAVRDNGEWVYITPFEGFRIWIIDDEQFCLYDGDEWLPMPSEYDSLSDLLDVDMSTPPEEGQALVWDNGIDKWVPGPATPETLGDIGDVDLTVPPTEGQTLVWDDDLNVWIAGTLASSVSDLTDVDLTVPPEDGEALIWDTGDNKWKPGSPTTTVAELGDIGDVDLTVPPEDGQVLSWDETSGTWVPVSATAPSYPTMTGKAGNYLTVNETEDDAEWTKPKLALSFSVPGVPEASVILAVSIAPKAYTLPSALATSYARCETAPIDDIAFIIRKNGASIGTVDFTGASQTGAFTFASDVSFSAGDRFELVSPSSLEDGADFSFTFSE